MILRFELKMFQKVNKVTLDCVHWACQKTFTTLCYVI